MAALLLAVSAGTAAAEGPLRVVAVPKESPLLLQAWTYLAALLAGGAVYCLVAGLRVHAARTRVDERIGTFVGGVRGARERHEDHPSFRRRTLTPLLAWLARVMSDLLPDRQLERIRTNLVLAGLPYSRQLAHFLAAKALVALSSAVLTGIYLVQAGASLVNVLTMAILAGLIGFYLPGIWLGRRIARRREQVLKALPDALDLLSISVSAGLGFDGAMLEVVQRWKNPLTEEFAAVLRDLKLGQSRRDALHGFAQRTGVPEVTNFVAAVIQADELGMPIKEALQIQAEQIRLQRRHRAEELARKATIKMLIPMAFFIFPAMFVVLVGPAVPSLKNFLR